MSDTNLPVSIRPDFPQAFTHFLAELHATLDACPMLIKICSYETPESIPGACDGGYPCPEVCLAGSEFCGKHQ